MEVNKQYRNCGAYNYQNKFCYKRWKHMDTLEYCGEFGGNMKMTETRFIRGKGIFVHFPTETIIDMETNERYYDGIKPNYKSSIELVYLLNTLNEENRQLKIENRRLNEYKQHKIALENGLVK